VVPVVGSQIRTVSSSLAEASQDPSGATANANTVPVWPQDEEARSINSLDSSILLL
jgi:hypothetical protein